MEGRPQSVPSRRNPPQKGSPVRFPLRSPRAGSRNPSAVGRGVDAAAGTEMTCAASGPVARAHGVCGRPDSPRERRRRACRFRSHVTPASHGRGDSGGRGEPGARGGQSPDSLGGRSAAAPMSSLPLLVHTTPPSKACFGGRRMARASKRRPGQLAGTFLSLRGTPRPSALLAVLRSCVHAEGQTAPTHLLKCRSARLVRYPQGLGSFQVGSGTP